MIACHGVVDGMMLRKEQAETLKTVCQRQATSTTSYHDRILHYRHSVHHMLASGRLTMSEDALA